MDVSFKNSDCYGGPVGARRGGGTAIFAAHRAGFTMVELVFALLIMSILVGMAMPKLSHALARSRVDSAAVVLASDLELALSLSVRQGTPVRISYDVAERMYRFTDRTSGTVLHSRRFSSGSGFAASDIVFSEPSVDVFPRRVASTSLRVTISAGEARAGVDLMPGGLIRVVAP